MNFDEINYSQDFDAFIGLQVPTDSLHDVVMFEIEELIDYEWSKKDNPQWIDGFEEGNLLADESENISVNPRESLITQVSH